MRSLILFLLFFGIITACGRIPEPVGYEYSQQHKMQAGYHWEILAEDTAQEINRELILNDFINTPVYVRETCGDENTPCEQGETTVFNESFRDLLITKLVGFGVPTSSVPSSKAITINYKAQTVYHHARRARTIKPGLLTALTAGIVVLRDAPTELIAILTAGAVDSVNATLAMHGHFEVLITTSLIADSKYIYRNSNIYYINDADSWHYMKPVTPAVVELTAGTTAIKQTTPTAPTDPPEENVIELPRPIIPEKLNNNETEI